MEVLIDFEKKPLLFTNPESIISCYEPADFLSAIKEIEDALKKGFYVAGFLSYEAGYCFEERLFQNKRNDFPLILMGVYRRPRHERLKKENKAAQELKNMRLNISKEKYSFHIDKIRWHIQKGDVYQITYCIKFHFDFYGDPLSLYDELFKIQPVPYPAYIQTEAFKILSLSPERFIKKNSTNLLTEPMKGTWPRGASGPSDFVAYINFRRDQKNRAENLMIADLLRNDLGRIGSNINWSKLFTITKYKTLYQMTSTVTAKVPKDIPIYELFAALFPSGSVTGTPKIRAMEIIRELETEERKIYTGAIGYIAPNKDFYFNIPIRTVLISGHSAEMGVGGGIVWDSTADGEWQEGLLKARFLTGFSPQQTVF